MQDLQRQGVSIECFNCRGESTLLNWSQTWQVIPRVIDVTVVKNSEDFRDVEQLEIVLQIFDLFSDIIILFKFALLPKNPAQ